ncbi:hypothetical protein [Thermoplasma sp.]|nr:hypothetical protein [Thermoplasma sp.]
MGLLQDCNDEFYRLTHEIWYVVRDPFYMRLKIIFITWSIMRILNV